MLPPIPAPSVRPTHATSGPPLDLSIGSSRRAHRLVPTTVLVVAALMAPRGAMAQQPSFGPLSWEEGAPLQRLAFTPVMEGAELVGHGRWSVDLYNGYSNIFEQDSTGTHLLFIDMERLTTAVTVRWGAAHGWEVGGRVSLETTGPGFLDGFVLDWHDWWGFGNANRDRFPLDEYDERLTDGGDGVFLDKSSRTFGLRDVRAFAKWRAWISGDRRSLLSVRTVLRLPAHGRLEGNRRPDGSLAAIWRLGMGSWYTHGLAGVSVSPASESLDPVLVGHSTFLTLALERSLGASVAALAQIHVQSAALRTFDHRELDRAPTSLLLGLAGRIGTSWSWDASFQEDVPADTPAVDFTVALSVSRSF